MKRSRKKVSGPLSPGMSRRSFMVRAGQGALLMSGWSGAAFAAAEARSSVAVPYYSSRSDLESTLACARMVLGAFEPEEHFPIEDVADMIFHRPGFWVFESQLIPILEQKGYRVRLYATTPYSELTKGEGLSRYGPDAKERIDCEALAWASARFNSKNFLPGEPDLKRALAWLNQGDLIMISAQRAALRNDPSLPYCRYNLVLTGVANEKLFYHDPAAGPHRSASIKFMNRVFTEQAPDLAVLRVARKID